MIKEKYITSLSYILIISSLLICSFIYFYNKITPKVLTEPEYVKKIFDKNNILEVNINISEENFNNLIENALQEEYVPADITINDKTIKNVGIRAKGNSSLQQVASNDETDRFSFKINFSEYITDQNLYGLEKLVLNNMIGDATYMKEYLSYDVMEFLNVNTPAYSFANIKINNEDWGLYLAVETLEEDFLERYYGKNYGNLYKPESDEMGGGGNKNANKPFDRNNIQPPNMQNNNLNNGINENLEVPNENTNTQDNNLENIQITSNNNIQPPIIENNTNLNNNINENLEAPNEINNSISNNEQNNNLENIQEPSNNNMQPPNMQNNNRTTRNNTETSLLYIDDNISSYSKIFDSVVTKGLSDADKKKFIKMVKALNTGEDIEKYLDIDEVLRYFAANTFLVNLDSYAGSMKHNYYLYEENGVFQILPWDFNLSFGTFQMNSAEKVINFPIDTPVTDTMENSPLISSLLNIEEYKNLYHTYLNEIINDYINSGKFENTVNYLNNLIYNYVENDKTAFYTIDEYINGVENLLIFGKDRAKSISLQLNNEQPSTEYGTLETTLDINALGGLNNRDRNEPKNFEQIPSKDINNNVGNNFNDKQVNLEENSPKFTNRQQPPNFNNDLKNNNFSITTLLLKLLPYFIILIISLSYVILFKRKKY